MATHNGALFLREQIDSILNQLDDVDELIISDDASADDTLRILASYNDARIRIIKHDRAIGVPQNFEASLMQSKGQYIFLADQDDVWLPSKKAITLRYLQTYDLVVSDCFVVDCELVPQHASFHTLNGSRKGFLKNLVKNSYMGCCMAFRREMLSHALPFPKDIPMHDQWIGMIGEIQFSVYFMSEALVFHRKHHSNASSTGRRSTLSLGKKLKHRYNMIKNVFHRAYAR